MNFDDLKSAWEEEENNDKQGPIDLEELKTARMPLEQLRSKIKCEFWAHCVAILFTGLLPQIAGFAAGLLMPFYALFTVYLAICIYYSLKFYSFYKGLSVQSLRTKDSLYETYYGIRLHLEMYKSYTYSLLPFAVIFALMFIASVNNGQLMTMVLKEQAVQKELLFAIVTSLMATLLGVMLVTEFWVKKQYGKYADQIRALLDQLNEA